MNNWMIVCLFLITSLSAVAQKNEYQGMPSLVWPKLYDIAYEKTVDDLGEYDRPIFSAAAKSLAGKMVVLPGYMVPFDSGVKGKSFILSSLPLNACFFCGVGGPESVIQVYAQEEVSFNEKPVEVQGILRLNDTDPDQMIYILDKAKVIGEAGL